MEQDIKDASVQNNPPVVRKKKEHFLGTILLVVIIFFILSSAAGVSWVGYSQWRTMQAEKNKPTIQTLTEPETAPVAETERQEATATDAPSEQQSETPKDITKEEIAVLNGGAAAGAAGKLAESLKTDGLTALTTGSTVADFTGTTVYYQKEKEAEAKALLTLVQKTYKDAVTMEQDIAKKESTTKPLTVILGATASATTN